MENHSPLLRYRLLGVLVGLLLAYQWLDGWMGFLAGLLVGYYLLSILIELPFGLLGQVLLGRKLRAVLLEITDWADLVQRINHEGKNLSEWELNFVDDLIAKEEANPSYIADKASNKQIGRLLTIYVERVKGIKLKDREYAFKWEDPKSGATREVSYGQVK